MSCYTLPTFAQLVLQDELLHVIVLWNIRSNNKIIEREVKQTFTAILQRMQEFAWHTLKRQNHSTRCSGPWNPFCHTILRKAEGTMHV